MEQKNKNIFSLSYYFILFFLIIYGPRVFGSNMLDVITITSVYCIIAAVNYGAFKNLNRAIFIPFIIFIFLFTYTLFLSVLSGLMEFTFAGKFLRSCINYLGIYALVYMFNYDYKENVFFLLKFLLYAIVLHSIIMLIQYVSYDFGQLLLKLNGYDKSNLYRVTGLTVSYNTLNVVQSFGFFTAYIFYSKEKKGIYILLAFLILIAMLLAGRTSFLLTILLFIFYLILDTKFNIIKIFKYLLLFFFLISITNYLFKNYAPRLIQLKFNTITSVSYNEIINLDFSKNEFNSTYGGKTLSVLNSQLILPESLFVTFFGNGNDGRGKFYIKSDIGYVKYIYGVGLFGSLIIYIMYFYIYRSIIENFNNLSYKISFLIYSNFALIFLLHAKEQVVLTRHAFSITFILFIWVIIYNSNYDQKNV